MKYQVYICRKCGNAQGTSSRIKGTCVFCRTTNLFKSLKNPPKILKESDKIGEITNIIKQYNANKENVYYANQKK